MKRLFGEILQGLPTFSDELEEFRQLRIHKNDALMCTLKGLGENLEKKERMTKIYFELKGRCRCGKSFLLISLERGNNGLVIPLHEPEGVKYPSVACERKVCPSSGTYLYVNRITF